MHLHLRGQAISKLDWPCALPLLSSSHVFSSFQNMNFLEGFLGHQDVRSFSSLVSMRDGSLVVGVVCFSSSLSWLIL